MVHASADHVVGRLVALHHQPHRLDVLGGVAPVATRVEVSEQQRVLEPELDRGGAVGDLAGYELEPAAWTLVVETNPRARVQAVALAVVDRDEVAVGLRYAVGAARVERRRLVLGRLANLAEHLARRRLVEAR